MMAGVEQAYQQAALDAAAENLRQGRQVCLQVTSPSMRPFLRVGDQVVAAAIPREQYRPGDVVLIRRSSDWVTHRLFARRAGHWLAKGDAVRIYDPPVQPEDILGKVIAVTGPGKDWDFQHTDWRILNRLMAFGGRFSWLCVAFYDRIGKLLRRR